MSEIKNGRLGLHGTKHSKGDHLMTLSFKGLEPWTHNTHIDRQADRQRETQRKKPCAAATAVNIRQSDNCLVPSLTADSVCMHEYEELYTYIHTYRESQRHRQTDIHTNRLQVSYAMVTCEMQLFW